MECRRASVETPERLVGYLGVLLATVAYSGHIYMVDELMVYETTRSLVERGDVQLHYPIHMSVLTADGRVSPFPPGPSILAIPLYLLGKLGAWIGRVEPEHVGLVTRAVVMMLNVILSGLGLALTARLANHWGANKKQAAAVALTLGLGSFWWVYSQTLYRQIPAAILTLYLFEQLVCLQTKRDTYHLHRIGVALALLLQVRMDGILMLPILLLGAMWPSAMTSATPGRTRRSDREVWETVGVMAFWTAVGGLGILACNILRSGSPFNFSTPGVGFDYPIRLSLPYYFASWRLSIFLYSPPLLLVPFAGCVLWKKRRRDAVLILLLSASYLYVYARYNNWTGGISWGPRFTLVQTPIWIATLGAWLAGDAKWKPIALLLVTLVAFPVQLLGVLLDQRDYHNFTRLSGWTFHDLCDTWWLTGWPESPALTLFLLVLLVGAILVAFTRLHASLAWHESEAHSPDRSVG